jgi:glycerol-3-phosphate dehydrogenase
MGPCQGGFCGYRAAGILHETGQADAAAATDALADFAQRRWKGQLPLLWGQSLRQALLDEHIYRSILGLDRLAADPFTEHPERRRQSTPQSKDAERLYG